MEAGRILQSYLDRVAVTVMTADWETYADLICMPFHLVTHAGNIEVSTLEKLRQGFDDFRQTLQIQQITDYIRLVDSAAQLDAGLISGRYVSHLLSRGHRVLDPFYSEITLRLEGNQWRAASITNALANSRWPLTVFQLAETPSLKGPEDD